MKLPAGLRVGVCSHTGLVRGANEDDYLLSTPQHVAGAGFIAAVADGMGGAAGGAEASRTALRALGAALLEGDGAQRMRDGFVSAGARVAESAAAIPALRDMGTTLTALWLQDGAGAFGHIGDSRLYRCRDDQLSALTVDHSLRQGESLLTRCIGGGQAECEPDCDRFEVVAGDRFLLCTDGVWNVVPERVLATIVGVRDPQQAAERLVRAALDGGGPDNATGLIVVVVDPRDSENQDVDLPRHERPGARAMWPAAGSLRAPLWPWLLLLLSVCILVVGALRLAGVDLLRLLGLGSW
ncbi:MAG: protein phosphatase 2C domain-containing protein [Planctomycetota bacterium]|nr:protein phosphatase 2C domain-containing protein [Planctomycetota bacterium]